LCQSVETEVISDKTETQRQGAGTGCACSARTIAKANRKKGRENWVGVMGGYIVIRMENFGGRVEEVAN